MALLKNTRGGRRRPSGAVYVLGLATLLAGTASQASPASDALEALRHDTWATNSVRLADLGVAEPVVLSHNDSRQEFFLPVPRNVVLSDPVIDFQADYLKGTARQGSLVLLLDGQPVVSQAIRDERGRIAEHLPLPAKERNSGFVRLGVDWDYSSDRLLCETDRSRANAIVVSPDSQLVYRYDTRSLSTLEAAWDSLPSQSILSVPAPSIDRSIFDSAWRLGLALERGGRQVQVRAVPGLGDTVDIRHIVVPEGLAGIPAFASLRGQGSVELADPAQLGALLVLNARSVVGDVVLLDATLASGLNAALDALEAQFGADEEARRAFQAWRQQRVDLARAMSSSEGTAVATIGGHAFVAVAADAGKQAAGLFDRHWKGLLTARAVTTEVAVPPTLETGDVIGLTRLGAVMTSFDVLARGDWHTSFPLGVVAQDGRVPTQIVVDLAAAPGAQESQPVATLFWNGVLLAAKRLEANGQPERLSARVPGYALGLDNVLTVTVQRQPSSVDCHEIPQAYPATVLPSSYVRLGAPTMDGTFIGLLPSLAGRPELIVPESSLSDAAEPLQRVIRVAAAGGLSPWGTELVVVGEGQTVTPTSAFLSMDVPVAGAEPRIVMSGERLLIRGKEAPWLDVTGLTNIGAIEVVRGGGESGLLWQALGQAPGVPDKPFVLSRGDVVLLTADGPAAWFDSTDPAAEAIAASAQGPFYEWRRYLAWGVPAVAIAVALFLLLLFLAWLAGRKRRNR